MHSATTHSRQHVPELAALVLMDVFYRSRLIGIIYIIIIIIIYFVMCACIVSVV